MFFAGVIIVLIMDYKLCRHCGYWFDIDSKDYCVIFFHGEIDGYICGYCKTGPRKAEDYLCYDIERLRLRSMQSP
jgi:hypothetical protein